MNNENTINKEDINQELNKLYQTLIAVKAQHAQRQLKDISIIRKTKRMIARLKTKLSQAQ